MGFTRQGLAEAERPRVLPRTDRIETEEELPQGVWGGYHPTMVLPRSPGERRPDIATDDTRLGPTATDEGALAERLTRDRIHRSLFGELAQAPTIGRYTFLKELGQGGMGVVCTAYDPKLDRKVAIKLTRSLATASPESRARILREAQAMARLSHPNVVQVYEVGELREELFVAMEFIDGVDLSEWLAAERRSWREVQRVFIEAGRGLAAAHAAGLVHRDFKPANVFVGADGRVIVGDFGLARASEAAPVAAPPDRKALAAASELATPLTATGALLGTPAYMAPESFEHNISDASSDQFAFCVALFEALHGRRPFAGGDVAALVRAVLHEEPTIPAGANVPGWLQQVALRGLRKRPEERWPSMNALLAALSFDPAARARGLRRGALAVSAVTVSVLGFGWLAAEARERAGQEESAKLAAEAARDEAFDGLRLAAERSQAEASRARDALRLAALRRFDNLGAIEHVDDPTSSAALLREVEAPEQLRGWRLSAVEALEQPIAKVVLPGWYEVAFTPDGQYVVTRNGHESASVWRADGTGAPVTFGAREGGWIGEMEVSPDGRHVALGYRDGLVHLHAIDGAGAPIELRGPGHQVTDLQWRGDSSALLVNSWEKQAGVTLLGSQLWQVREPGAGWVELPGHAAFIPNSGQVLIDGNRSPYWGPQRNASVQRSDGGGVVEFPDARWIKAAPAGDAVLVITERALQRRGLDGAKIGAPLDHAALLAADDTLASATFTPDGARIISTTSKDRVFVWDVAAAKLLREVDAPPPPQPGMLQWGLGLAVSPDSALFARGYDDRTVRVWDIDGKHAPMTLRGHLHAPEGLTFSPDSRTLATTTIYTRGFSKTEGLQRERGDFDYTIRLWPIPEARTVQFSAYATKASESDLRWVSFSPWVPDGRGLVLNDGLTLRLVDAKGELMAPPVEVPKRHEHLKEPIFAADGGSVTFESANHWVRWDLRDPSRLEAIAHPEGEQRAVKAPREHGKGWSNLSRDGALVFYVSPARDQVRVYRFGTQELVRQFDHDAAVERVEFSPDGDRILTVAKDRRVRVWSISGDASPALFEPEGEGLVYPLWSPDGRFAVLCVATSVKDEYAFHVWRPGDPGAPERRITTTAVLALTRVSPDGRHLALLGSDDRIRLVATEGEQAIRELDGVDSEPGKFEFSRDGAWLISAASNAAFVWSTTTGAVVRVLRSPERRLSLATFDPSGTSILLGDRDGQLSITPFDPELARADLQQRLRAATSYCYSHARRRVDLNEPPALAWANFAACERSYGRELGEAPDQRAAAD
jgi:WD40 repeat protein/predicted Ser/Thr protein kinase